MFEHEAPLVNDHYCCCCCNVCIDASNNFDANRLAYRFKNKDVTETNSNNNNNNRSTQACTYRVTVVYTCDDFATSHTHAHAFAFDLTICRFNGCAFWHIIYSTFTSSNATHSISYSNLHTVGASSHKTFIMRFYMAIVCVGFGIGCLNFQKFGLSAIVSLSFSVSFFFIVVLFCSAAGASNRAKKRFSRENQVEAKKNGSSAKNKRKK